MPTYNGKKYILQAIQSILDQTYVNLELIIVDDGSTDGTHELILDCFSHDSRIRLIRIPKSGVALALNKGIELSRGKYIARLDADDIAESCRLYQQVNFLEKNHEIGVLGGAAIKINAEGKKIGVLRKYKYNYQLRWLLLFKNAFIHPSVMIRKDLLIKVGCYNNVRSEDADLWVRLAKITCFHNLDSPLIKYRIHDNQTTIINELYNEENNRIIYGVKLDYWKSLGLPKLKYEIFLAQRLSKTLNREELRELFTFLWKAYLTIIVNNKSLLNSFKQRSWLFLANMKLFIKYL